ncbi:MAG TPA: hypothetical protein PKN90_04655 [Paludibacteraceae bacterium]|nr:hypothetical protein [Paludibacteraceae bacterium]
MAYDKKKIYEQAKEQIVKNNLFFVEDIVAFLPCGKSYFYDTFTLDSDEMHTLKEMLDNNKIKTKSSIRAKLYKSEKAAELLALYRLIATPEEHRLLNQQYIENKNTHEIKGLITTNPLNGGD